MKPTLSIIALTIFLSSCGETKTTPETIADVEKQVTDSAYCKCTDLIFNEPYNHFYLTEKREGFTGKCEDFYENGELKLSKNFINGKVHGKMIMYYDNGQIEEEKEFDMNFQTGEQITYTKKGEVIFHALYERGNQIKVLITRPDLQKIDPWESTN